MLRKLQKKTDFILEILAGVQDPSRFPMTFIEDSKQEEYPTPSPLLSKIFMPLWNRIFKYFT